MHSFIFESSISKVLTIEDPTPSHLKKKSFELPSYITATMQVLEKLSVKLATWFALNLFFRPLDFPIPERERPMHNQAKKTRLRTAKSSFMLYEWGDPSDPSILLIHGWSGRGTQFNKIIQAFLEKGFHLCAIDAPAHGDSGKKKTHMLEFVDAIEVVIEKCGPFNYAIGHSLGGMAIFNALKRNLSVQKIVTIGTPDSIAHVVRDFCEKVKAGPKVAQRMIKYIEARYSMKVEESSTDFLARKYNPEGMIIHDEDDQDVGVDNATYLASQWNKAELMITRGLGHRRVLMDQEVIDRLIRFLPRP